MVKQRLHLIALIKANGSCKGICKRRTKTGCLLKPECDEFGKRKGLNYDDQSLIVRKLAIQRLLEGWND